MSAGSAPHRFVVGGRYENRLGPFEVIAIERDRLRLRWDDGREIESGIEQQERILANMERELAEAARPVKGARAALPAWLGGKFQGLAIGDFAGTYVGTYWRSREQLGGAVTRALKCSPRLISWGVKRRPEIHWALLGRYDLEKPWTVTKFFVRADERGLHAGLYFERSGKVEDRRDAWQRWLAGLEKPANADWFHRTAQETGNSLFFPYGETDNPQAFRGQLSPEASGWVAHDEPPLLIAPGELTEFVGALSADRDCSIVAGRIFAPAEAIALGAGLADALATLFSPWLPAYFLEDQ